MIKNKTLKIILLILISVNLFACASISSPPPLPANLEIAPPSKDVPPEIAAFQVYGKVNGVGSILPDTIIVVEKIDSKTAEVLFSVGGKDPGHFSFTADVLPGPIIKWVMPEFPKIEGETELKCPCTMTFQLNRGLNSIFQLNARSPRQLISLPIPSL